MSSACVKPIRGAVVALLCVMLWACGEGQATPEQRVRLLIEAMEQAIEDRELRRFRGFLHTGYSDTRHRDRRAAVATLFALLRRHHGVHLFTVIKSVELKPGQDDAANAVVYVAMTGVPVESVDALVSLKADLYRFRLQLVEEDDEWQVVDSRWERVDPGVL